MGTWFTQFSTRAAKVTGNYLAFVAALGIVLVWAATGPFFGFTDRWQLMINSGTTIVTFLMVFLIQHTQYRDSEAVHLKLDELIHSIAAADDDIINAEDETDEQLAVLKRKYQVLAQEHHELKSRLGEVSDSDTSRDAAKVDRREADS